MQRYFVILLVSVAMFFVISMSTEKMHHSETEMDFVILANKVGNPTISTVFRVNPEGKEEKDPNYCQIGGDKLYTPYNVSVFNTSNVGDVLRRYHTTDSYRIFGKIIYQNCYDVFWPLKIVSLYPDMNYWPFGKDDLKQGDPDYNHIMELTQSQR